MNIGSTIRRAPRPVNTSLHILGCIQTLLLAETILQWRRGEALSSYFTITKLIIYMAISILVYCIIFRNVYKREVTEMVNRVSYFFGRVKRTINYRFVPCRVRCGIFQNLHFMRSIFIGGLIEFTDNIYMFDINMFRTSFTSGLAVGLFKALTEDFMVWLMTDGNRIDIDTTSKLFTMQNDSGAPHESIYNKIRGVKLSKALEIGQLDVRYYLCDELRRPYGNLELVKDLLEAFPGYLYILDRDGLTTPFELACRCSSVDIVQYMVEFNDTLLDYRDEKGNTPLHWACRYLAFEVINYGDVIFQGLNVVNYILEKRMSLVTVANNKGDLPIHVASDTLNVKEMQTQRSDIISFIRRSEQKQNEIVWRLLLAYPECWIVLEREQGVQMESIMAIRRIDSYYALYSGVYHFHILVYKIGAAPMFYSSTLLPST